MFSSGKILMKIIEKLENNKNISKIALNRRFFNEEEFESLVNKGFQVAWMEEDIKNDKEFFSITIPEN